MIQPILINLYPNEYSEKFHFYPFAVKLSLISQINQVKLHKYVGSWNTLNDLYDKRCVPNEIEDLNLGMFNMDVLWMIQRLPMMKL